MTLTRYIQVTRKPHQRKQYRAFSWLKNKKVGRPFTTASQAVAFSIKHDTLAIQVQAKQSAYDSIPEEQFEDYQGE